MCGSTPPPSCLTLRALQGRDLLLPGWRRSGLHSVLLHLMDLRMYASLSAARVEDGGEVPAAKLAIFILIAKSHFPPDIVMHTCSFFKLIYFNWRLTTLQY